jgi:hypothetical protein
MTLQELKGLYDLAQNATVRAGDWRSVGAVMTAAENEMQAMAEKLNADAKAQKTDSAG